MSFVKEWLKVPDTQYTTRQIIRWLWQAWRGNRLQATLNALVGLLQVGVSLASVWAVQRAIDVAYVKLAHEHEERYHDDHDDSQPPVH